MTRRGGVARLRCMSTSADALSAAAGTALTDALSIGFLAAAGAALVAAGI